MQFFCIRLGRDIDKLSKSTAATILLNRDRCVVLFLSLWVTPLFYLSISNTSPLYTSLYPSMNSTRQP